MPEKMPSPNKTTPYPLRLTPDLKDEIAEVAGAVDLPFPETMRQAIKLGLPRLRAKLSKTQE